MYNEAEDICNVDIGDTAQILQLHLGYLGGQVGHLLKMILNTKHGC